MKNAASIRLLAALGITVFSVFMPLESAAASICFGTSANGRVSDAVALPAQGENYAPYSSLGVTLGRTHVHQTVRDIVIDAYAATYRTMPATRFLCGETGLSTGGPFKPHRPPQNGTSVDFMVPVLDGRGKSVALPSNALNKFGYALEFDAEGKLNDLQIDFEGVAEHLYQLAIAGKKHGADQPRDLSKGTGGAAVPDQARRLPAQVDDVHEGDAVDQARRALPRGFYDAVPPVEGLRQVSSYRHYYRHAQ